MLGVPAGYGLLTLEGAPHLALRKFMNRAFAFKYLHQQFDQYYKPINSLVQIIESKTQDEEGVTKKAGREVEITKLIDSTLLDIICLTAFGYDCDSLHDPGQPLARAYHELVNLQDNKNMFVLFSILGLPFGPQFLQWAVNQNWLCRFLKRFKFRKNHRKIGLLNVLDTVSDFVENVNVINEISSQHLETKLSEAIRLKQASGGNFDESNINEKVDILSLLVKASLDESSNYKMDSQLMQA